MDCHNLYSPKEELANTITHGFAAALSLVGFAVLLFFAVTQKGWLHITSCSLYGATLVFMYTASTLYHSLKSPRAKGIFRVVDQCAIYLLIAGTYTPFTLINLRGSWGWALFGAIWAMAVGGVLFRCVCADRFPVLAVLYYVAMGWLAVVAIKPLFALVPSGGLLWIGAGGLFYMVGIAFYAWRRLAYHHAYWHVFTTAGSVCHYFAVVLYVLPVNV
jgi:hemolysin III